MLSRYTRFGTAVLMLGLFFLVNQRSNADAGVIACKAACAAGAVACTEYCDANNLGITCKAGCAAAGVVCTESCDLPEPEVPEQ